jgi:hypothetical protein
MATPFVVNVARYCTISFKSTLGVTRDPKNHFDISTIAKIWRDTSKIFDIGRKIWAFSCPTTNFEHCVMLGGSTIAGVMRDPLTPAKFRYRQGGA